MFDGKGRYNPCRYLWSIYPKDRGGHCAHITGAGSYPCSAKKNFFTPVCHFFVVVKPLLVSKFLLESERRLRARSIQPKFRPVRPGKVAHLKRWTSFFETFPVGPNQYPLSFGWMDCALKFPEWYVLAGDLGFPLLPLPPPPPRFPPIPAQPDERQETRPELIHRYFHLVLRVHRKVK